jgi:hypothetical protein
MSIQSLVSVVAPLLEQEVGPSGDHTYIAGYPLEEDEILSSSDWGAESASTGLLPHLC